MMTMLRPAFLICAALSSPAFAADLTGKWRCDYAARPTTSDSAAQTSWFTVTLAEDGSFKGNGKSIVQGLATPNRVKGSWTAIGQEMVLDGTTLSPFGRFPFRFETDIVDDTTLTRAWARDGTEYETRCQR